jgi:hypothetical protein
VAFEPAAQAFGNAATLLAGPAFIPEAEPPHAVTPAAGTPSPATPSAVAPAPATKASNARAVIPDAAPYVVAPKAGAASGGGGKGWLIALIVLMVIGGAVLLLLPKGGRAPDAVTALNPEATPPATPSSLPPAEAPAKNAIPEPGTTPPSSDTATAPSGAESAPAPAAAPAASASAAASANAAPAASEKPAAAPDHPPIEFDLRKLAADRAVLYVRSSAKARVFVHGTDYGETNNVLVTSCGIRFVRLGQSLGNFIEPGASRVIKCGRINEIAIEPTR